MREEANGVLKGWQRQRYVHVGVLYAQQPPLRVTEPARRRHLLDEQLRAHR